MPGPHQPLRVLREIDDRQKMRRQLARAILHREIFLVIAHHRDQNLFRKRQECRIKIPHDHRRVLVKVCNQLEQRSVLVRPVPLAACERARNLRINLLSSRFGPAQYEVLL